MTATHSGHCQGCGRHQKLPKGVLSLHGYTVQWGFFNGTCGGSKQLPYEQSCDYCKLCVVTATKSRDGHLESQKRLLETLTEPVAAHARVSLGYDRKTCKTIYKDLWKVQVLEDESRGYMRVMVTFEHEDQEKTVCLSDSGQPLSGKYPKTALEAAQLLNAREAAMHAQMAEQLKTYIDWQQKRIDDWKPAELTSVAEEKAAADVPKKADFSFLQNLIAKGGTGTFSDRANFAVKSQNLMRARRLVRFGFATIDDEGRNKSGNFVTITVTDAGRKV